MPLPEDPNDSYYKINCFVCKKSAKQDQEYIRSYGGVVCFGCRAFFRRAHRNNKIETFVCKNSGKCDVIPPKKHGCKRCRYDGCVKSGMSHEAILTEDQTKNRFRKMLLRRERENATSKISDIDWT